MSPPKRPTRPEPHLKKALDHLLREEPSATPTPGATVHLDMLAELERVEREMAARAEKRGPGIGGGRS